MGGAVTTVLLLTGDQILNRVLTHMAEDLGFQCVTVRTLDEAERVERATGTGSVVVADAWALSAPGSLEPSAERIARLAAIGPLLVLEFAAATMPPVDATAYRTLTLPFELDQLEHEVRQLAALLEVRSS